jgi:hypothetical protein
MPAKPFMGKIADIMARYKANSGICRLSTTENIAKNNIIQAVYWYITLISTTERTRRRCLAIFERCLRELTLWIGWITGEEACGQLY